MAPSPAASAPAEAVFVPLPAEQRLSALCAQTFVRDRTCLPRISVLCLEAAASPEALRQQQRQLARHEGYPHLEWLLAARPGDAVAQLPEEPGLPHRAVPVADAGAGAALRALLAQASGDFVLLLGPQTLPQMFCLFQLILRLRSHPEVGLVAPLFCRADGSPWRAGWFNEAGLARPAAPAATGPQVRQVAASSGACLLGRRQTFAAAAAAALPDDPHALGLALCRQIWEGGAQQVLLAPAARVQQMDDGAGWSAAAVPAAANAPSLAALQAQPATGVVPMDLSVVTCTNDYPQYVSHVCGSLLNNYTARQIELVPILNAAGPYSAAAALNAGIDQAHADVVVLCHQDVVFYKAWIDVLFVRLAQIEARPWAILGTAGIRLDGVTSGAVQKLGGSFDWNTRYVWPLMEVQTVDEHCMVLRKSSGVRFDAETLDGFHFYGPDICLTAWARQLPVLGIYNPLVHNGSGGSLRSGEESYTRLMRRLAQKWSDSVPLIRTPTGLIQDGRLTSYLRF